MVSIILPTYNVAPYLAVCLDSILSQSYSNWELIAIDDKSNDGTLAILENYAKRDSRIHVYALEKNLGVSLARNFGLERAKGKWIMFVDGDDILHKFSLEKSVTIGEDTQVEIVMWNMHLFNHSEEKLILSYKDNIASPSLIANYPPNWPVRAGQPFNVRENSTLCEALFVCPFHSPVNKLFLHQLLLENKLKFVPVYHEDIVFTNLAFLYAKRLVWIANCLYYYRKRSKDAESFSLTQYHHNFLLQTLDSLEIIYREMQRLGVLPKAISGFVRFLYNGTVPGILEFPDLAPQWYPMVRKFWLEVNQNDYSKRFLSYNQKKYLAWVLRYERLEDYLTEVAKHRYLANRTFIYFENILWLGKSKIDIRYGYHKPLYRYSIGLFNLLFVNPNSYKRPWYIRLVYGLLNPLRLCIAILRRYLDSKK